MRVYNMRAAFRAQTSCVRAPGALDHGGDFAAEVRSAGLPADVRNAHKDKMTALALAQLTALFGPKMAEPREIILQDWATLPEIARPADNRPGGGHPNYGLPANLKDPALSGIHFGSTETAQGFGGFLEGALEAAEATAKALSPKLSGQTCSC